jgi:hypothetical protein
MNSNVLRGAASAAAWGAKRMLRVAVLGWNLNQFAGEGRLATTSHLFSAASDVAKDGSSR